MTELHPSEYLIQGITQDGRTFRPSDWSERLAGAMYSFCPAPGEHKGPNAYIQYSYYVRPVLVDSVKCVVLDSRLRKIEPMAFDFVLNFAKDNNLVVTRGAPENSRT